MKKFILFFSFILLSFSCKKDNDSKGLFLRDVHSFEELAKIIEKSVSDSMSDQEYFLKWVNEIRRTGNSCNGKYFPIVEKVTNPDENLLNKINSYEKQITDSQSIPNEKDYITLTELSNKNFKRYDVMKIWYENCNDRAKLKAHATQMAVKKFGNNWILILK